MSNWWDDDLINKATYERKNALNGSGDLTYSAPVAFDCRIEKEEKTLRRGTREEVISDTVIVSKVELKKKDRIKIFSETSSDIEETREVLFVEKATDLIDASQIMYVARL